MPATLDGLPKMADLSGSLPRFDRWINNFGTEIANLGPASNAGVAIGGAGAAGPPATGLFLVAALVEAWNTAYALVKNTGTRVHGNVLALHALKDNPENGANPLGPLGPGVPGQARGMVGALRALIAKIQAAGNVTPGDLGNLGLTPKNHRRSVAQIPSEGPEIWLEPSAPHTLCIRYAQEGRRLTSKAKPPGCKGVLFHWVASGGGSGSVMGSKNPTYIDTGAALSGQVCRVQAYWQMGNNKISPGGPILQCGIP